MDPLSAAGEEVATTGAGAATNATGAAAGVAAAMFPRYPLWPTGSLGAGGVYF